LKTCFLSVFFLLSASPNVASPSSCPLTPPFPPGVTRSRKVFLHGDGRRFFSLGFEQSGVLGLGLVYGTRSSVSPSPDFLRLPVHLFLPFFFRDAVFPPPQKLLRRSSGAGTFLFVSWLPFLDGNVFFFFGSFAIVISAPQDRCPPARGPLHFLWGSFPRPYLFAPLLMLLPHSPLAVLSPFFLPNFLSDDVGADCDTPFFFLTFQLGDCSPLGPASPPLFLSYLWAGFAGTSHFFPLPLPGL